MAGFTWMDPVNIPNSPAWGTPGCGFEWQSFYWRRQTPTRTRFGACSSNAKNGSVTPTFDQSTAVNLGGNFGFSEVINPGGLVGQLFLAVDRSGTSTNNNVYMQARCFRLGAGRLRRHVVRSTDGGPTFSAPAESTTIRSIRTSGTGSAPWGSRRTDASMRLAGHAERREQYRFAAFIPA